MQRIPVAEREDWKKTAREHGFDFHTIDNDRYWDESAYYRFSLRQIEDDLEEPLEELEQMCFAVVERAVGDEEILFHECDRKLLEETRRIWPFFRDRRIETYGGLTKRWLAE